MCTISTASRFGEDTWKVRGPDERQGLLLGTLREIDVDASTSGNGQSSTSPNTRSNASGTTENVPHGMLSGKVQNLNNTNPTIKHPINRHVFFMSGGW